MYLSDFTAQVDGMDWGYSGRDHQIPPSLVNAPGLGSLSFRKGNNGFGDIATSKICPGNYPRGR